MFNNLTFLNKKFVIIGLIVLLAILSLVFIIFKPFKQPVVKEDTEITTAKETPVVIALVPSTQEINLNETKSFDLVATFPNGSPSEKIDYFKATIHFSKDFLQIPKDKYIDTSTSGLKRILRVDGPSAGNATGTLLIEIGASVPDESLSTGKPITFAKIFFSGKNRTQNEQEITLDKLSIVNSKSTLLPVVLLSAKYQVK
ncbi:hypothetical protein HZB96_02690 [Candidatus Gottesmanbacteria bacterium]|nr:hypothetical protein [Candidatus Gottesmanbacteria bacterium]MBI5452010.1 hypothetical protein [Candidatus Gottesmanbacteria bacterium]